MINDSIHIGCTCTGCVALISGNWWLLQILTVLLFTAVILDFYHIWRRCKERNARLERIIHKKRPLKPDEEDADASEGNSGCHFHNP